MRRAEAAATITNILMPPLNVGVQTWLRKPEVMVSKYEINRRRDKSEIIRNEANGVSK